MPNDLLGRCLSRRCRPKLFDRLLVFGQTSRGTELGLMARHVRSEPSDCVRCDLNWLGIGASLDEAPKCSPANSFQFEHFAGAKDPVEELFGHGRLR